LRLANAGLGDLEPIIGDGWLSSVQVVIGLGTGRTVLTLAGESHTMLPAAR
jgi:hypothetical protein